MKNLALICTVFVLALVSFSQSNNDESKSDIRVRTDKPTVYLEYVCQDDKNVYLRINNNSIWYIVVWTKESYFLKGKPMTLRNGAKGYAIPANTEANIFYGVEKDELENVTKIKIPKMESQNGGGGNILSQDSVIFPLSINHLKKGLKIYVDFSFEWDGFGTLRKEPTHRVYFRGGDIGSANTGIVSKPCSE